MSQARDAAMRAVARSFAMPLRAAGIDASVAVRFVGPGGTRGGELPRSAAPDRKRRDDRRTLTGAEELT